ncbi:hypothetical protein OC842_007138 [Tilletia horrida]|uniref:Actin-like ATPase domain-containing protein n=1 Tax=Tilletia horrida TaxID=155126 RepID=A0AAN6G4A1_9BASI|nr:hypothetical protein OC842_007138 [Tilletia horrida]
MAGTGTSNALNVGTGLATTIEPIVIDVGTHTVKFGFAGEPRPRAIVPTVQHSEPNAFLVAHPHPASAYANGYAPSEGGLSSGPAGASSYSSPSGPALWDLDFNRCKNERVRKEKTEYLLARLTTLFRKIINQHLMCDPKARRVILIENPLTPTVVKECIYTVLFKRLGVPAVTPLPSPFLALFALGLPTGLLLSLGHLEATITPIFHGAPISSSTAHPASLQVNLSSTRASGARLTRRLRALLIAFGQIIVSPPPNPGTGRAMQAAASSARGGVSHRASQLFTSMPVITGSKSRVEKVTAAELDVLGPDFLEQVKVKALMISGPMVEGMESLAATLGPLSMDTRSAKSSRDTEGGVSTIAESLEQPPSTPGTRSTDGGDYAWTQQAPSLSPYDSTLDNDPVFLEALKTKYMQHTATSSNLSSSRSSPVTQPLSVLLPHVTPNAPVNRVPGLTLGGTSAAANVLASATTPSQHKVLVIPAWVRERCAEILFEARTDSVLRNSALGGKAAGEKEDIDGEEEDDECGLTELVLRALQQVPMPLRRHFASRIAIAGGTGQLQGLAHRLRVEVVRALEALERITYFSDVHGSPSGRSPRSSSDFPSPSATSDELKEIGAEAQATGSPGPAPAVPRLSEGLNSQAKKPSGPRRIRRTEAESALLADVPSLPTHELPLSWRRRYSKIGTLWRFVRIVNDHHPPNSGAGVSGEVRNIPVSVGPVLNPEEILASERNEMLAPHSLDHSRRRGRRSMATVQAAAESAYIPMPEPDVERDPDAPYVPIYAAVEQQSLRKAHEHDVRYNLLNPKDTDRSKPYVGIAPTLAPSLLPWVGGSLIGSLRVSTAAPLIPLTPGMPPSEKDRDAGDLRSPVKPLSGYGAAANAGGSGPRKSHAAAAAARRSAKDAVPEQFANPVRRALYLNHPATPDSPELPTLAPPSVGHSVFLPVPTAFPGTISRDQFLEDDAVRRRLGLASFGPNASAASAHGQGIDAEAAALLGGKGSFVGVVGGLDTGAYGGLAAVSRHMRGAWAAGGGGGGPTSPRKE